MSIEVVCACGRVMHAAEADAGKRGRCRACGAPVTVAVPGAPDDAPLDLGFDAVATEVADSPFTIRTSPARRVPREPWYYGVSYFAGAFWTVLGALGLCGGAVFGLLVVALTQTDQHAGWTTFFGLMVLFYAFVLGAPFLLLGMLLMLAVDAARNLRALRYERAG